MSRFYNWIFVDWTLSTNYQEKLGKNLRYLIVGLETAPTTGELHHQGYLELNMNVTLTALKEKLEINEIHLEPAKGNAEQNKKYCSKEKVIIEYGKPKHQGKRKDLDNIRDHLKDGARLREISEVATSYQSFKFAECYLKLNEKQRDWMPKVYWFWGPPGTGKTHTAWEEAKEDRWISNRDLKWWDGYDGHENIIIDDFRPSFCELTELFRILDSKPYQVHVKGSMRQLLAKKIWITCPFHWKTLYEGKTNENLYQLERRITETRYFKHAPQKCSLEVGGNTNPDFTLNLSARQSPNESLGGASGSILPTLSSTTTPSAWIVDD